jgi:hypothetical protein
VHVRFASSMHPTPSSVGNFEKTEEPLGEVEYICIAADLLQQMFDELRSLATGDPELAQALAKRGSDAYTCLWTLHETVDLMLGADDSSVEVALKRCATALISWLSDEFNDLTLCAGCDSYPVDTFRVVLH